MKQQRMRQVHLDFHTSEHIPHIGRDFDANEFARTLKDASVDSITCFARCHHGWLYYPSKRYPEKIHPHLERRDLLGEQIEACHAAGIQVPVYVPIQWDHLASRENPGWLVKDADGKVTGTSPYEAGFYNLLCMNTPYIDYVIDQALEVLESYDIDGLFFDIINVRECSCIHCRTEMQELGMDAEDPEVRKEFTRMVIKRASERISGAMREVRPDIPIFYNHSHVRLSHRDIIDTFTHLELESLPSGGWGYWDFPVTIRYARTLGVPCLGQTGKFHTAWGDFGSLKRPAGLEFECFRALAFGAGCSIGDQLHPYGKISKATYDLISPVYASVAEKEPWCIGVEPVVEIGVVSPDRFEGTGRGGISDDIKGCTRMLQELSYQFNIIDEYEDFSMYKLIVLPDHVAYNELLEQKLKQFIADGGAVLGTFESGLKDDRFIHLSDAVSSAGLNEFEPDFFVPNDTVGHSLTDTDYVMYHRGRSLNVTDPALELAGTNSSFFNRTWEHFCSHKHAPSTGEYAYPFAVKEGKVIHLSHPVFTTYNTFDPPWYQVIIRDCIRELLPVQLLEHDGPSSLIATLNMQPEHDRQIIHLLHYIAERRGDEFDTIHDVIPVQDISVTLQAGKQVKGVRSVPSGEVLDFTQEGPSLRFIVPEVKGHHMVEIAF